MSYKPTLPKAAEPQFRGRAFDPWNSVAAGHQRAETRGPGGWRENRAHKLNSQFRSGNTGGRRIQDVVGNGVDPEQQARTTVKPEQSVLDMLRKPGAMKQQQPGATGAEDDHEPENEDPRLTAEERLTAKRQAEDEKAAAAREQRASKRGIFEGLVVYVNGSTHPLISDHKLKRVLAEQGARTALHLGRRQVTHVIVGRPAAAPSSASSARYGSVEGPGGGAAAKGAGGGLAGGKIQREISRMRGGCGVKFVGVEWVLESLKAGVRLPEARFAPLSVAAPRAQPSVLGVFGGGTSASTRSR